MFKNKRKSKLTFLSVLAILSLSTIMPALVSAAPRDVSDANWVHVNGNSWAQNYSPQTQINSDNIDDLEVKWLMPLTGVDAAPAGIKSNVAEGTTTPPIVVDGVVYVISNSLKTYAVDALTGKQLWVNQYTIDFEDIAKRIPVAPGAINHLHGFRYWETGNVLLSYGLVCDFFGVDADSGETTIWVKDLCVNVPGNKYDYKPSPSNAATIGVYEKGHQFIVVQPGRMHSNVFGGDARHVTLGIDTDTHEILWRIFSAPPHGVKTKDWALQECDNGYFHIYPCSDVAAKNQAGLEWDFALEGEAPSIYAGVTANWGQMVVDEDTGMAYTQTGNQGPYSNMSLAPGPRLYGSTIYAIDLDKGQRVWWLQPFPHDPYDYDCNWSGILADTAAFGKVYIKGCKEGTFYVIDAATGVPIYAKDVIPEMIERGQIGELNGPTYQFYRPDPNSYHDMREWNWISWPATKPGEPGEHATLPFSMITDFYNGLFATDMSFDPETQTLILHEDAITVTINQEYPYILGAELFKTSRSPNTNSTIVARDIATGEVKWTYFDSYSHQRAALVITGGLAFTAFTDGFMRFFDKDTGELLNTMNLGSSMVVQPTIGKDSTGDSKIFVVVGATRLAGAANFGLGGQSTVPGTLIALGLNEKAAAQAKTTTVTTTAINTVTEEGSSEGLSPTITYAAVAVAIIAIIAVALIYTKKIKI